MTLERIADLVGSRTGFTIRQLRRKGREEPRATARAIAMYVARNEGIGLREIGRFFRRTPSAVWYADRRVLCDRLAKTQADSMTCYLSNEDPHL